MRAVFPSDPQIHVAGAPVEVEPLSASSPYRAIAMSYSTVPGVTYDAGSKQLVANLPGFTVIRYLIAPEAALGSSPDTLTHSNYFQVVRTVAWNDPLAFLDGQPATVGTPVSDPRGPSVATNSPKSGWVVNALSPYDGAGADAAHDRATQTGPIIPVNKDAASASDDLVVAFYKRNPVTGALWPDLPARFNIAWLVVNPTTGEVADSRGWRIYKPSAAGLNSITLGDGAETSLFTLIDNWFVVRYRGYNVAGATNWSDWVGDPASTAQTRAAFAPGWVKRVIEGINPFEARTTNFHDNASLT